VLPWQHISFRNLLQETERVNEFVSGVLLLTCDAGENNRHNSACPSVLRDTFYVYNAATTIRCITADKSFLSLTFPLPAVQINKKLAKTRVRQENPVFLLSPFSCRPLPLSATSVIALIFPLAWIIPLRKRYQPSRPVCCLYQDKQDKGHRAHTCHSFLNIQFSPETLTPVVRKHIIGNNLTFLAWVSWQWIWNLFLPE
jgi:hypothetical protein